MVLVSVVDMASCGGRDPNGRSSAVPAVGLCSCWKCLLSEDVAYTNAKNRCAQIHSNSKGNRHNSGDCCFMCSAMFSKL